MDLAALGLSTSKSEPVTLGHKALHSPPTQPCPEWLVPATNLRNAWRGTAESAMISAVLANRSERSSLSQRAGKRYEARVMAMLLSAFPAMLTVGPWFMLEDDYGQRPCQPDALLVSNEKIVIIEVKRTHTCDAWWQLRRLYEPVVRRTLSGDVAVLEICRSYDPAVRLPERVRLLDSLQTALQLHEGDYGVLQWR